MSTKAPSSIDKSPLPPGLDWKALIAEGRELLQALAGDEWTDFNEHDPGTTLLEALAYALTDVGHRTQRSIPDLMTSKDGTLDRQGACFYPPAMAFPSAPVTLLDLRKVLIDEFPALANVWILPSGGSAPGRYQVWVLPVDKKHEEGLALAVTQCLSRYRTLGDVFEEVNVIEPEPLTLQVQLRLPVDAQPVEVLMAAQDSVASALCPPMKFLPRVGALAPAWPTDELYDGPLLMRGVLPDETLWLPRDWAQLPELITHALLSTEGILEVSRLKVSSLSSSPPPGDMPLAFTWDVLDPKNEIELVQGTHRTRFDPSKAPPKQKQAEAPLTRGYPLEDPEKEWEAEVPAGTFVDPARHDPVQEDLPPIYGLHEHGLPASASPARAAQVKQLRAYLFMFEQILANDCEQLAALPQVLSWRPAATRPYHWQPLYGLVGAEELLPGTLVPAPGSDPRQVQEAWKEYQKDTSNPYAAALSSMVEGWNQEYAQAEDILDHLLARFGEFLPQLNWRNFETEQQKRSYLKHWPELSIHRHIAFDRDRAHIQRECTSENVSALERKVNLLLAAGPRGPLKDYGSKPVPYQGADASFKPYPGRSYFLVELPLLLPPLAETPAAGPLSEVALPPCELAMVLPSLAKTPATEPPVETSSPPRQLRRDFFSGRLVHVLANWTFYERTPGFVAYVESFIRQSAPAHLEHRFVWLCDRAMTGFAKLMQAWYKRGLPPLQIQSEEGDGLTVQSTGCAAVLVQVLEMARDNTGGECAFKSPDCCGGKS